MNNVTFNIKKIMFDPETIIEYLKKEMTAFIGSPYDGEDNDLYLITWNHIFKASRPGEAFIDQEFSVIKFVDVEINVIEKGENK